MKILYKLVGWILIIVSCLAGIYALLSIMSNISEFGLSLSGIIGELIFAGIIFSIIFFPGKFFIKAESGKDNKLAVFSLMSFILFISFLLVDGWLYAKCMNMGEMCDIESFFANNFLVLSLASIFAIIGFILFLIIRFKKESSSIVQ